MVWQFERFEGVPHLEDYADRKNRLGIMFPTDSPKLTASAPEGYLKLFQPFTIMPTDFFKVILPCFSFPHYGIPHSDGYDLLMFNEEGVIRQLMSDVKDPKHPNVTYVTPKKVGYADFQDLSFMGEYAARRIPQIPHEIRKPAKGFERDLPRHALDSRAYCAQETALLDWNDFVKVVGGRFKELFLGYVMKRFDEKKLSPDETKTLVGLVQPLGQ